MQWLNPNGWMACISGTPLFTNPQSNLPLITFIVISFLSCYGSVTFWAIMGGKAAALFANKKRLKLFNQLMGGLLATTTLYLAYGQFIKPL